MNVSDTTLIGIFDILLAPVYTPVRRILNSIPLKMSVEGRREEELGSGSTPYICVYFSACTYTTLPEQNLQVLATKSRNFVLGTVGWQWIVTPDIMSSVASPRNNREVEIKLKVASAPAARRIVRTTGFRVYKRRVFEDNLVLDTADLALRRLGKLLRVREAGRNVLVTYKGLATPGKHKSREELEVTVSDARKARLIFERLGFLRVFRYQKYRTEYRRPRERGVVTLDETPIGCFLEIEGAADWIDRTARRFGFQESDYITGSYGGLYLGLRQQQADLPADMVFPDRAT
jgi:adenylate cyclase class 2